MGHAWPILQSQPCVSSMLQGVVKSVMPTFCWMLVLKTQTAIYQGKTTELLPERPVGLKVIVDTAADQ